MAGDDVAGEIYKKIERENLLIDNAVKMRAVSNPQVQAGLDAQIKEGRRNVQYLEDRLRELQASREMSNMSLGGPGRQQGRGGQDPRLYQAQQHGGPASRDYQDQLGAGTGQMPPRAPFAGQAPGSGMPKTRPNYSKLDLIKADTTHLGPRYQLMLSQLAFKLSVEKQYKDGIEKVVRLYDIDGDKKSRAEAEGRRIECNQKIQLLSTALRRYEDLNVGIAGPDEPDDDSINSPQGRKPLSGQLTLRIHAVKDVQHALSSSWGKKPSTFVQIKVEDMDKGTTRPTRNDRWTEELHHIEVDKANEIELTVYDKLSTYPSPIGMLWIRISDIVDEMRRKKIESELAGSQWVTAEQMQTGGGGQGPQSPSYGGMQQVSGGLRTSVSQQGRPGPAPGGSTGGASHDPNTIETWFSLEPVGSIMLSLTFNKQNKGKSNFDMGGIGRKGAVRQRKEDVHEQYGHKFISQQFFNIMRCALCGEYIKYNAGMQCEDCKFLCHQKCFTKVVTKCISKSNAETDPDELKVNHRIPHRFEPFSNLGANWCCHCGYILPLGKKSCKKCSECGLTVHASCAHLVPDFCGISMLTANELLARAKGISSRPPPPVLDHRRGAMAAGTLRKQSQGGLQPDRPSHTLNISFGQSADSQQLSEASLDSRRSYGYDPTHDRTPMGAAQQAFKQPPTPSSPTSSRQERPGLGGRTASEAAAAAAATALQSKRPPSVGSQSYNGPSSRTSTGFSNPMETHPEVEPDRRGPQPQQQQQPYQSYDPSAYDQFNKQQTASIQQQHVQQNQPRTQAPQAQQTPQTQPPAQPQAVQQKPRQSVQKSSPQATPRARIGLDSFNFLAVLGKGNFGKVMLAETKTNKKLFAIKVLKKEFIIENDEVESTRSEKRVFLIANKERHPFLLNLHACFQTETRIYFVMEYISGGDLMLHIQRGQFGLKRTVFYASEVCLALKYFHENGVTYRDLKLDNIMLTMDGHIKVADYGLCKEDMWYGSTTGTFCGTPEFMAPEILLDKKYGRAVDWWAFGVLIYQMLLQQSPFRGEDEDEIYDAILADEPLYPIHMPRDSVAILQKLLTREPEHRLGSGPTDAQEIMSQPFFKNVNWEEVREKRIPPPYLPQIKSATDTSNFDSEFTSVTPVLTPVQSVLTQAMQEEFRGFTFQGDFE